jgi:RNA polymerase sigma factor (sigma-70 family)
LIVTTRTAAALRQVIRSATKADRSAVSDRELLARFAEQHDQSAFSTLVRRYTGMVLGVCRRVLPNVQDAEDACQATFLILARKATAGRWRQSVANWLYTTARRVAANARLAAQRRAKREGQAAVPEVVSPVDQMTGRELLGALDEELDKLPPRYREPLVLCYLEGLTRDEAATRLGVPAGTVKIHLERGRKRLGEALTARGCALGAGLLALAATSPAGASPPRLVEAVLAAVSGSPPAAVAALAKGGSVNALLQKSMLALFALVAASVLGIGMGALQLPAASQKATKETRAAQEDKTKDEKATTQKGTVSGRVLSPDGKPLAGADLLLVGGKDKGKPVKLGVTGADGRFTVTAPRQRWVNLLARSPGLGVDFIDLGRAPAGEIELRLVKDHPIRGRVIDTEGKPVKGVRVSVSHVGVYGDTAERFLALWKKLNSDSGVPSGLKHVWDEGAFPSVTTDRDGRFTITGVGAERAVSLRLGGAGIADAEAWVLNRAGFDPRPYNRATADNEARRPFSFGRRWLLNGPEPSVVAEAEKPIRGVVKDIETGKPRVGVKVTLSRNEDNLSLLRLPLSATTGDKGRYEIRGAHKAKGYMVEVPSDPATGHMACQARAADTAGYEAITINLAVKKGVVITGRVIDGSTRKAMPGFVMASVLADNPHARNYPEFSSSAWFGSVQTGDDGTFRVVTIPGPVILMGGPDTRRMPQGDFDRYRYKPPRQDKKYPKYFSTKKGYEGTYFGLGGGISPLQGNFAKVLMIDPGISLIKQDVVLEPANALSVKVVDSAGRPVAGTWATGISPEEWHRPTRVAKDSCSAYHLEPGKPRLLVFYEPTKKLFGTLSLKGDEKDPAVVKLGPGATVKGRLLDEAGRPLAGVALQLYHRARTAEEIHAHVHRANSIETDAGGKFVIDGVVPGVKFGLWFSRGKRTFEPVQKLEDRSAEPGKPLDLGDVKLKANPSKGE